MNVCSLELEIRGKVFMLSWIAGDIIMAQNAVKRWHSLGLLDSMQCASLEEIVREIDYGSRI